MSRFLTKILNEPPGQQSAKEESQLSTNTASQLSTNTESQLSTNAASQLVVDSKLSTKGGVVDSKLSTKRVVASRKRRVVASRKGDRHRGGKVPFNNRLSEDMVNQIKHFCVDHGLEQQEFVELAAIHFMHVVDSHKSDVVDSMLALDDRELMILYRTSPSIINLYLQYNPENRWKPADDHEGQRYNEADIRLVEIGIIQTQFNARFKKINSFKYYTTEIDIALEVPLESETIDVMLKQGRRRWAEATGNKA
jgi:hypothetical protein